MKNLDMLVRLLACITLSKSLLLYHSTLISLRGTAFSLLVLTPAAMRNFGMVQNLRCGVM